MPVASVNILTCRCLWVTALSECLSEPVSAQSTHRQAHKCHVVMWLSVAMSPVILPLLPKGVSLTDLFASAKRNMVLFNFFKRFLLWALAP
jgi:hypothetical protein